MNKKDCIKMFKELILSPHACICATNGQKNEIDFEMNGPLYENETTTQFIIKCKKCGYCHSMHIPTHDALIIRKFCLEKGAHTSDRFQKLDCHVCKNGNNIQWECIYFPKAMMKACKGFFDEEAEFRQMVGRKVFP